MLANPFEYAILACFVNSGRFAKTTVLKAGGPDPAQRISAVKMQAVRNAAKVMEEICHS